MIKYGCFWVSFQCKVSHTVSTLSSSGMISHWIHIIQSQQITTITTKEGDTTTIIRERTKTTRKEKLSNRITQQ